MDPFFFLVIVAVAIGILFRVVDLRRFKRVVAERDARIATLEARVATLEPLAFLDELTCIGNRRKYDDALSAAIAHALRKGERLTLLHVDVNDFKGVNDRYGHPFGDRMLRRIAECLDDSVRPTDVVCRIGGDEYGVILVDCGLGGARTVVERVMRLLAQKQFKREDATIPLSVSVGGTCLAIENGQIVVAGDPVGTVRDADAGERARVALCEAADERLYAAKERKAAESCPVEIS